MVDLQIRRKSAMPWGGAAALLAACFATIAGLVRGIDPDVILWRAIVAATAVGSLTVVAHVAAQWVNHCTSKK